MNKHINGYQGLVETFSLIIDGFIFKTKQIALSSCFTSIHNTGVGLPKIGVKF